MTNKITVQTSVNAPVEEVWEKFSNPDDIVKWNNAGDDWHTTSAVNDLKVGGKFNSRMEAKDGSSGFNFTGTYDEVVLNEKISYTMDDGRRVEIIFEDLGDTTKVTETFDPEQVNTPEFQQSGWQSILDNFKKYVEGQ